MNIPAATPHGAPASQNDTPDSVEEPVNGNTQGNGDDSPDGHYDELSLDELVNADFGNDSAMQGTHKGLNYADVLKHIPEAGRKVIQNLRASYTTKTQEISALRQQVEAERVELSRQREMLTNSEFAKGIAAQAAAQPQHDMWSDEGLEERINQKAAALMAKMLTPLQQDLDVQKRGIALEQFKKNNPDLVSPEIRMPVAQLLRDRPELKLEDAYYIVKGQVVKENASSAKQAQKQILSKTSTGNAVRNSTPPKFASAWDAYQYHKANAK